METMEVTILSPSASITFVLLTSFLQVYFYFITLKFQWLHLSEEKEIVTILLLLSTICC